MEEMGLKTTHIDEQPSYLLTWFENNKWKSNIVYKTKLYDLNFTPTEECVEIGFFTKEETLKLDLFPNVIKLLNLYIISLKVAFRGRF